MSSMAEVAFTIFVRPKQYFDLEKLKKLRPEDSDSSKAVCAADVPPWTLGPDWRLGKFVAAPAKASLLSKLLKMSDQ